MSWQQAYLTAPIWRFWLGADICGVTVIGALMSSLDGVGRYYPLTVFAVADEEAPIPPPEIDSQDAGLPRPKSSFFPRSIGMSHTNDHGGA